MHPSRRGAARAAAPLLVLALAGCGGGSPATPTTAAPSSQAAPASVAATAASPSTDAATTAASPATSAAVPATTAQAAAYPVTVADCKGEQLTFDRAPQRVVTLDPAVTEIMIQLGLQDRIVGVTLFDTGTSTMWAPTRDVMRTLKVINDPKVGYPAKEAVLAQRPDLVVSEYDSAFSASYGPATRDAWRKLGVATYLTHGGCGDLTVWHDLSPFYQDVRDLGAIFGVPERAEALIAGWESRVAALQAKAKAAGVPDYAIGTHDGEKEHPGTLGTWSANALIELAGSHYAFVDDDHGDTAVSWETFVKRNPQVIWVITGLGTPAATTEAQLEHDPRVAGVTAVKDRAFVVVDYDDAGESPRLLDGLEAMVDGLIALQGR